MIGIECHPDILSTGSDHLSSHCARLLGNRAVSTCVPLELVHPLHHGLVLLIGSRLRVHVSRRWYARYTSKLRERGRWWPLYNAVLRDRLRYVSYMGRVLMRMSVAHMWWQMVLRMVVGSGNRALSSSRRGLGWSMRCRDGMVGGIS